MTNNFLTPKEISESMVGGCNKKAGLSMDKMLLLGILAGAYIGLGAYGSTIVNAGAGSGFESVIAKLLGAGIFPIGLMLVVFCGAELFTGNCLMTISVFNKEITVGAMLRNWGIVYFANLIGGVLLAYLLYKSGLYGSEAMTAKAIGIAEAKVAIPLVPVIIRAIFCNILVVLAVWMATGAKDIISKIFAIWFPVMLFVLAGFEHSVANMFFLPIGYFLGADFTISQMVFNNLIPVTIGNIIGGAIVVPGIYFYTYLKKQPANEIS
ncbi:formate/nitrite transporter family protein [Acetobacterium sp.]|uniref:formate/nitrite transporter family protein n=1 Tax=Acetobacterium sp. TaxID=1872094 RepID=UPI002F41CB93